MRPRPIVSLISTVLAVSAAFAQPGPARFGADLKFVKQHVPVIVLSGQKGQAEVMVIPGLQGRVLTSTAAGPSGLSFGWVNRELIASGKTVPHFNAYGGEDRFWIGPEGGQFSLFFSKGAKFDLAHWQTPAGVDTEPWQVIRKSRNQALVRKSMRLRNYSNTLFSVQVDREVRLLSPSETFRRAGVAPAAGVDVVGYETVNTLKNTGPVRWTKKTGLLSIWILGMMNASPSNTIVIPFKPGPVSKLGRIVNDEYFGKVPADRLVIKKDVLYFKADYNWRSKIGISPRRDKQILGSYDSANHVLTLVQFTQPAGVTDYVNSMWRIQKDPFAGDTTNAYNDGPSTPGGKQMGHFYELESSSPALALRPGQSATHIQRTMHFVGSTKVLDKIARTTLGVSLADIQKGLPH